MAVPIKTCQPSMRRSVVAAEKQMEAYALAKNVTVALLKKHKAAWKERNQNLAINDDFVGYYHTRNGLPTTWDNSSESK